MSDDPILEALVRLEAGQADVSGRLAQLEAGQADVSGRLTQLEAGQTSIGGELLTLRTDFLAELGSTRGAIMEKVSEVQASIVAIRDDIGVNMGGVDAARKANDNTREDMIQMREQMSVMWKQIKALEARVRDLTGDP